MFLLGCVVVLVSVNGAVLLQWSNTIIVSLIVSVCVSGLWLHL
jgi:hypothetical protein